MNLLKYARIIIQGLSVLLLLFFPVRELGAQASVNMSTLDLTRVYRDIDGLVAQGLVDKIIVGQRPYSRKEIARIISESMKHLPRLEDKLNDSGFSEKEKESIQERLDYLKPILNRLKHDYQEELIQLKTIEGETPWYSLHAVEKATADLTGSNSPSRAVIPNNGAGWVEAFINPLLQYQQGRELIQGVNPSLETIHWGRFTNHFALYVQPRFQLAFATGDNEANDNNIFLLNLYGKVYFKNFELEVGRDNVLWGQGKDAGVLFSNNPRGFDMVKISNDSPAILPSFLKYLGPVKFSYFLSTLGPQQYYPYPYLIGYKLSLEPVTFFELGLSMLVESGGENSPPQTLGQRVLEGVPFGALVYGTAIPNSKKMGGFDFRFRIPQARNLEFYGEFVATDSSPTTDNKAITFWVIDSGFMGGMYLGRLTNSGNVDLRIEYHHMGPLMTRHGQWRTGQTLNGYILGDNLGPDAQGFYLTSNFDINPENILTFNEAVELRSGNQWGHEDPGRNPPWFVSQGGPSENRYRTTVEWLHRMKNRPLLIKVQAGYEFVQSFNYINENNRNNFLGEIALQVNFDQWIHSPKHNLKN